jgi:Dolichyl-phosphate-mannose-protein mannosyltransferase
VSTPAEHLSSPASPRAARAPARGRRCWLGIVVVVLGALLAHLPGYLHQLFDSDEAAIATAGMVVERGGTLYRDVIDRKPPIPAFVYAGSFLSTGSRDLRPLHVVAALCLAASAVILAYGARRAAGATAGWWAAGLLIAGATALQPTDAQAANFAHLALLPGCGALVAARAGSRRSAIVAGILVGVATLTRQTWIIGVVPAAYAAWWSSGRRAERVAFVLAGAAVTIAAVAIFVPFGAFWHWTFAGDRSVLALGESQNVGERGGLALELFVLANVASLWLILRRGRRREDLDLWLWLATGLIAFVAGWRFFGHYWMQVLPPMCFLAGLGAAACRPVTRRMLLVVVAAPAIAAWVLALSPARLDPTVRAMATYATTHTHPGDRVTVWGNAPEVYWLSGRAPGGSMVNTDFVTGKTAGRANGPQRLRDATPGARDIFLRSLAAHPPVLFFDTSSEGLRGYRHFPVALVPPVARFVHDRYTPVATVHGVRVYRLRRGMAA